MSYDEVARWVARECGHKPGCLLLKCTCGSHCDCGKVENLKSALTEFWRLDRKKEKG